MPLFVPLLRLLMLFLNVYDSYKTLKLPPPSSKNGGQPSVRAMSQRKRDLKGCLAVWIVWVRLTSSDVSWTHAFSVHRGLIRTLRRAYCVCLHSVLRRVQIDRATLFDCDSCKGNCFVSLSLHVCSANVLYQGAEPIYLHLIRPFLKPYTATLDGLLEVGLMLGDFVLALAMYPVHLLFDLWDSTLGKYLHRWMSSSTIDTSHDSSPSPISPTSDIANPLSADSHFADRPASRPDTSRRSTAEKVKPGPSRKSTTETLRAPKPRPTSQAGQPRQAGPSKTAAKEVPSRLPARRGTIDSTGSIHRQKSSDSTPHQIWRPPVSAYEEEGRNTPSQTPSTPSEPPDILTENHEALVRAQEQMDEWRQYPPFPSAYPATPLADTARPLPTIASTFSSLAEGSTHEGFPRSLLPSHEHSNPGPAADLSDQEPSANGIPNIEFIMSDSDSQGPAADGNVSSDLEDDEDVFNTTLATPMPAFRPIRTKGLRPISISAVPSVASSLMSPALSTMSALTTDGHHSLRTSGSSESLASSNGPILDSAPIIGKRRSRPFLVAPNAPAQARTAGDASKMRGLSEDEDDEDDSPAVDGSYGPLDHVAPNADERRLANAASPSLGSGNPTSSASAVDQQHDDKRRRVGNTVVARGVGSTRAVKPRVKRHGGPTSPTRRGKGGQRPLSPVQVTSTSAAVNPGDSVGKKKAQEVPKRLPSNSVPKARTTKKVPQALTAGTTDQ